jgi:S1-C subfamily serine protease
LRRTSDSQEGRLIMPFQTICPDCQTPYNLADRCNGQKVRCKKCQGIFLAREVAPKKPGSPAGAVDVEPLPPGRRDYEPDREARPAKKGGGVETDRPGRNMMLWAIVGLVGFVVLFVIGPVLLILAFRNDLFTGSSPSADGRDGPIPPMPGVLPGPPGGPAGQALAEPPADLLASLPVQTPVRIPVQPAVPPSTAPETPTPRPGGGLPPERMEAVKRATVYVRVTRADGSEVSGSGFFGALDARNIVLTNAHVVGMLVPESRPPKKVTVVINSGQEDERKLSASVVGVDRGSDLALLDVGRVDPATLPKPLVVKSAGGLHELEKVYIFGFPLGERLGKEITIRPSTVASLRKKHGALHRVQVSGGMDEGNSGGPVVDGSGHVVGVAVSGIPGREINFAIPADYVRAILTGRITAVGVGQPFTRDDQVGVPVTVEMIDPRRQAKEVAVEVWTAPEGSGYRPPAAEQPRTKAGDSPHRRVTLRHDPVTGRARGDVLLPTLPEGQVYWVQPCCAYQKGGMGWSSAGVFRFATQPFERRPADLRARLQSGASGTLSLKVETRLRVGGDEDADLGGTRTGVVFREQVVQADPATGTVTHLFYDRAKSDHIKGKETEPSELWQTVRPYLARYLVGVIETGPSGKLKKNDIDRERVDQLFDTPEGPGLMSVLTTFHEPIRQALDPMIVPLPNRQVTPGEAWKAQRCVPMPGPDTGKKVQAQLTYTYLGRRNRAGRDEAVLDVRGTVPGTAEERLGGKVNGTVLVDLSTGQVSAAEVEVVVDVAIELGVLGGPPREIRVLATTDIRMQRSVEGKRG